MKPNEPGSSWGNGKRSRRGDAPEPFRKRFRREVTKGFHQAKADRQARAERGRETRTAKQLVKCARCGLWVTDTPAGQARHQQRTGCGIMA